MYARSNFLHLIWFRPFKKRPDYIAQNRQNPIWMAWSGFGQMHVVWKQVSVQESLGLALAECYRPSTSFPTLRLSCVIPQMAQIITCKTSLDPIWSRLTMPSLGQMDPAWKSATVQESSGSLLANASEPTCLLGKTSCIAPRTGKGSNADTANTASQWPTYQVVVASRDGGKDEGAIGLGGDMTERLLGGGREALGQRLFTAPHNLRQTCNTV